MPAFPTAAAGPSTNLLSGTDDQLGNNDTSYSFQTYAAFNGIDWSETGEKIATGSGGTTDAFSASASGLTFSPPSETGPYMNGVTVPGGSASVTGTSSTSYNYTQYAYLDDNGVWQNAATPASDVTSGVDYFGASGTTNWSLSGSGPVGTYQFGPDTSNALYGNSGSGTTSASGSGSDTYNYQEFFSFSPALGVWTPTGGSGSASGNGSATFGYSAVGGYSGIDPTWAYDESGYNEGARQITDLGNDWSGTVSSSGSATVGYGYSTNSTFSTTTGQWTTSGSASATASGSMSTSFSASSPFAASSNDGNGNTFSISGLVTGGGSDWASYNYTETQPLSSNVWGALSSGTGGASGGSSATWSYAGGNADGGDDTYSQTKDGGTVSGTLGESGSQTYNTGYNGTAAVVSGAWTQTGTGDANGTDTYNYNYAGSGSGASGGTTWHVTSESGSGSGSYGYDNPLTLSGGTLASDPSVLPTGSTTQEDSYAYNASNGYSGSEQETTTQEIAGNSVTGTSNSGSGTMSVPGGSVSWSPGDGTDSLWDQAGGGELGPQPGALRRLRNSDFAGGSA